jgi:hypothetical protein
LFRAERRVGRKAEKRVTWFLLFKMGVLVSFRNGETSRP